MSLRIGSLFSGVGGLELGLERGLAASGLKPRVVYQVERSAFCRAILARHYPDAQRFDDVRSVGAAVLPPVDLLCGGFPCQDVSSVGTRAGLAGARSGLWWEFDRIIGETRPRWVVIENVASGARRWLPFVRRALGARGYDSVPLGIAACEVGARHRRERIFVVGRLADPDRPRELQPNGLLGEVRRRTDHGAPPDPGGLGGHEGAVQPRRPPPVGSDAAGGVAAHPHSIRLPLARGHLCRGEPDHLRSAVQHTLANDESGGLALGEREPRGECEEQSPAGGVAGADEGAISPGWGLPPRPWMVRGVHGLPGGLDGPWSAAGWTPARIRAARIQALGNAVVPAQVEPVGRLIGVWLGGEA